ncbi:MAG: hypothetical protein AAGG81_08345, partial [Chlamydiota bacterium]
MYDISINHPKWSTVCGSLIHKVFVTFEKIAGQLCNQELVGLIECLISPFKGIGILEASLENKSFLFIF